MQRDAAAKVKVTICPGPAPACPQLAKADMASRRGGASHDPISGGGYDRSPCLVVARETKGGNPITRPVSCLTAIPQVRRSDADAPHPILVIGCGTYVRPYPRLAMHYTAAPAYDETHRERISTGFMPRVQPTSPAQSASGTDILKAVPKSQGIGPRNQTDMEL
jgi:hypothetical protein